MEIRTIEGGSREFTIGGFIGKGGEGTVYHVDDPSSDLVFKEYHEGQGSEDKLIAMLKNPPLSKSLAWPRGLVYDGKKFRGYVMKKLDSQYYRTWAEFSNMSDRRKTSKDFDFRYALAASINLAIAIRSVHQVGHCVGDVNESNIFISQKSGVFLVDCDSAQVKSGSVTYPCLVGKPEYVAPEISRGRFEDNPRTIETDVYAYSVAVTQLLTGGAHPTDGVFLGEGEPPSTIERNRHGLYPALTQVKNFKQASRIPTEALPENVKKVLLQGLRVNPRERVSLELIIRVFDDVIKKMIQCVKVKTHWFDPRSHDVCPWCQRVERGLIDPWGEPYRSDDQVVLPSLSFNDNTSEAPQARRASITTSTTTRHHATPPATSPPHSVSPPPSVESPVKSVEPPEKIKGKTVLQLHDGSWQVRPPLKNVFRQSPRLALYCVKKEIPSAVSLWWGIDRGIASPLGLVLGFILGVGESLLFSFIPEVLSGYGFMSVWILPLVIQWMVYAAIVLSWVSILHLLGSALRDMFRAWKQNGRSLEGYRRESFYQTMLRFIPLPFVYGLLGVISSVFLIIWVIVNAIIRDAKESRYR